MKYIKNALKDFREGLCSIKALYIRFERGKIDKMPLFKALGYLLWGYDIFLNKVPFLKLVILCNIIVWLILFWSK